jgi:hypothetical protein
MAGNDSGHFIEVLLSGVELADQQFQLSEAIKQGRQVALLIAGDVAETLDQFLDLFAFSIPADSQTVPRLDLHLVQSVAFLEGLHSLVQVAELLPVMVLFMLQV